MAQATALIGRTDARVLLQHVLGVERAHIAAHGEDAIDAGQLARYHALVSRRVAGEPVAYLTGWREFYGLAFQVTPAVLIPRPETELLVELALNKLRAAAAPRVLDLGTGSGAIAVAIAHALPDARVCAADCSSAALVLAQSNAARLLGADAARVAFVQSDWFAQLPQQRFDLIVSNPPYVAAGDAHLSQGDLRFEPQLALVGGEDGMRDIRRIVEDASQFLQPGGWLTFEHGYDQAVRAARLLQQAGFVQIETQRDLAGHDRVALGRFMQNSE